MEKIEITLETGKKNELSDIDILQCAKELLIANGMLKQSEAESFITGARSSQIDSDGSTRRFWRLNQNGHPFCIVAAPAGRGNNELAESASAWMIGNHLRKKGVPVPELYGWDKSTGVLLFEDLGDLRLHDIVEGDKTSQGKLEDSIVKLYHSALENLANMQCRGAENFSESWCWDSPRYDSQLMIEKESEYFLRAFWQDLLGNRVVGGVLDELQEIAKLAGEAPASFFLHRDFQSRNIMIKDGAVRFIDFQGGRLGPLGYDLASLLIDPYSSLPRRLQADLVEHYLKAISSNVVIDETEFKKQYMLLAFQRNMQIVGAFSFLYKVRKKTFFIDFIKPSLISLRDRLEDQLFLDYPLIRTMVSKGLKELQTT
jgi:aminoglycoside/choline kinase family phosphotransferase